MVRLLIIGAGMVVFSAVFLIAGCSDRYRYPCQDPANQTKQECTPPECEADGTCAKYLLKESNET